MSQLQNSNSETANGRGRLRILHVDDDPGILEVSKSILELESNFEVDTASSVDEAFKKLEKRTYDAVISDYEMPQKNGLQFLQELREKHNSIPFAIFTGRGREEVAIKALNLGADGYYNKQGSTETVYGELTHGIRLATERAKAKKALEESESRYRTLMEQAGEAIFVYNVNGQVVNVNQQACASLGYTREELFSMNIKDIDAEAAENRKVGLFWPKLLAGQSVTFETTHKRKDGSVFCVEATLGRTILDKKTLIIGIVRDATERKKMETVLRLSEEKFRRLFEEALDAIFVADAETGILVDCNRAACELVGKEKTEIVCTHQRILHPPEKNEGEFSRVFQRHLGEKEGQVLESRVITKNGEIRDVAIKANTFKLGNKTLLQGIFRDITERKNAEEALSGVMDQLVLVNEKLGVVGSLTRHDVRNKLSAVTGYAYLLKKKHADQADIVEGLGKIEQAVKDSVKIFEFAKLYEQLGVEELAYVDVEKAVDEAAALFSGSLNLKVINDCKGLSLFADSLLRQLFYNFMDNTRKHGKTTTTIRVHYGKTETGELRLIYEDNGAGISKENKSKIFTEGFSTGDGTGTGLFLIKKMTDVYGWTIQEVGEHGKGTKFAIAIPRLSRKGKDNFQIA